MPAPLYGSPSPYPDSPAAFSPLTISNSDRKTEDRTLSTDIKTYSAPLFESGDFSLFQKQKSDELSVAAEKVLSLVLFVAFEIICDSAGWMRAENTLYTDGRSTNTISVSSVSKYFRIFFQSHVTDKFNFYSASGRWNWSFLRSGRSVPVLPCFCLLLLFQG